MAGGKGLKKKSSKSSDEEESTRTASSSLESGSEGKPRTQARSRKNETQLTAYGLFYSTHGRRNVRDHVPRARSVQGYEHRAFLLTLQGSSG